MKANLLILIAIFAISVVNAEQRITIAKTADEVNPLLVGHTVPTVPAWTEDAKPIRLKTIAEQKPLVLVFYRGGWCPFCNHQLAELQDISPKLAEMGYELLAISPELPDTIKQIQKERELDYQLLSDHTLEVARAFGVAFQVDDQITDLIKSRYNAKLQRYKGQPLANLPVPAVFIINKEGVITFSYVNPNYQVRLHPDLLLSAAEVSLRGDDVRLKR